MKGFLGVFEFENNNNFQVPNSYKEELVYEDVNLNCHLFYSPNNKFPMDKLFYQDRDYILWLDGVIFNKIELSKGLHWPDCIIQLYELHGDCFFKHLKGSFVGLLFNKKKNELISFNDPLGDKQLFYYKDQNLLLISTNLDLLSEIFKLNEHNYTLDCVGAYMLLCYGFFLEDFTIIEEFRKLRPGHYILWNAFSFTIIQYFVFNNFENFENFDKNLIEELDLRFRSAVKSQFEKDEVYNYKHLVGLSGGLDSRMVTWVANDLGFNNTLNYTFSQTNYADEIIAKGIAEELNNEWIFKSLDNGTFLIDELDVVTKISQGGALYYSLAHGNSFYKYLNFDNLGLIHTGQLGDIVIGSFYKSTHEINSEVDITSGSYSKKLISKMTNEFERIIDGRYANNELFKLYSRGFNGANHGLIIAQQYSETFSPFYDVDFLQFCLNIPAKYRVGHSLYIKWVLKKYRGAASYTWESIGGRIDSPRIYIKGKYYHFPQLKNILLKKLSGIFYNSKANISTKNHMNPLDFWYNDNLILKNFWDNYYEHSIQLLEKYNELQEDAKQLFLFGNAIEKNQVITLLAVMNQYFNDK